jgi:hypothetical protein
MAEDGCLDHLEKPLALRLQLASDSVDGPGARDPAGEKRAEVLREPKNHASFGQTAREHG